MHIIIFFLICVAIWYLWIKFGPNHSDMLKIKFDYTGKKTSFYSKPKVIAAIVFWVFLLIVGVATSDARTTAGILGIITAIYLMFIARYFINQQKLRSFKRTAIRIPGRIVGIKVKSTYHYDYDSHHHHHSYVYLIVEYLNPHTGRMEEYVTKETVTGNPFYYLKSMNISVYYLDENHIWVDDFDRIKVLKDNMAYQLTGNVDGKDPGVLRYEQYE